MKFFKNYLYLFFIILILISSFFSYSFYQEKEKNRKILKNIETYNRMYKDFQSYIIMNYPIFEDYLDHEKSQTLRKYLYPKHLEIVKKLNLQPIKNVEEFNQEIQKKNLIFIDNPEIRKYYFFYNIPKENRYVRKNIYHTLLLIGERLNKKIDFKDYKITIKIAISSALRTKSYQEKLKNNNLNAVEHSTHSYGMSIDIFYDEYYVALENLCEIEFLQYCENFLNYNGFVLGGNLRRQLQSILAQTLIELQEEGILYVILEKNQRVLHITPIPKEL